MYNFNKEEDERLHKYIEFILVLTAFFYFMYIEAYGAILFYILFVGFLEIVVFNKKYNYMQRYIEKFI